VFLLQQETADFLQASGVGTLRVTMFVARLPSTPANALSVSVSGGGPGVVPPHTHNVQVLCRGVDYPTTAQRAEQIHSLLSNRWHKTANAVGRFVADHPVGPMYLDANNMFVFTLNYTYFTAVSTA
jgi:hypothetical protein